MLHELGTWQDMSGSSIFSSKIILTFKSKTIQKGCQVQVFILQFFRYNKVSINTACLKLVGKKKYYDFLED